MRTLSAIALLAVVFVGCKKPKPPAPADSDAPAASTPQAPGGPGEPAPRAKRQPAPGVELYGETGGEATLPADEAPPSAPLRARKIDTFYTLSNPRIAAVKNKFPPPPPGGGQVLAIDYVRTAERAMSGGESIVIRTAGGKDHWVSLYNLKDRAGTIELQVANKGPWTGALPKDAEFYLVRPEGRYGKAFNKTFKVSNSVVMGATDFPVTRARDWTVDEAKVLAAAPVEAPKANANPNAGEDTAIGGGTNPFKQRFAEPGKPLLGIDWFDSFWPIQNGREDCLGPVVPLYDRAYPDMGQRRTIAKQGYAVGALEVKSKTYVSGLRITFMKLKADGTLDPADSYQSPWLGPHAVGTKETKVSGEGRPVIGLLCYQAGGMAGGNLTGIGLVLENR